MEEYQTLLNNALEIGFDETTFQFYYIIGKTVENGGYFFILNDLYVSDTSYSINYGFYTIIISISPITNKININKSFLHVYNTFYILTEIETVGFDYVILTFNNSMKLNFNLKKSHELIDKYF